MSNDYSPLRRHSLWQRDNACAKLKQTEILKPIVNDKGSLTAELTRLGKGDFKVNVLRQEIMVPYHHEQLKLKRSLNKAAMIREVELVVNGRPVVFARSIVPLELVSNGKHGLSSLGRTPLGHLLFRDGKIRVSKREFAFIKFEETTLIARRTPYEYQGSSILVSEYFLPAIEDLVS